nr:immunoglobulin light chain junction region [Macaca mulatta]MOX18206.1 immunoglobulin light chain junction region [Macaca mulatta]MOX20104.1 immunoglobulin light chain junction region [Macaca mulatta]MOX21878.1 immunoglobulin light chain junction region [Macaca mulatta]MOX22533.1 immunoglobulin light chain junction region [Macaca mulatta]
DYHCQIYDSSVNILF